MNTKKNCLECGDTFTGRSDKLFCSKYCRTSWNNALYRDRNNYMRRVNNYLRRNRRILASLMKRGETKVSRLELLERGFRFDYFTNVHESCKGKCCYYCYEQGYMPLERDFIVLLSQEHQEVGADTT